MSRPRQTVTHLPIEALTANPANVRTDLGDLTDMALSIREQGILQPLIATEDGDEGLVLLAGHRRLAAALMAGEPQVPVIIRHDITDVADQIVTMIVENTQRKDLAPVERAEAYDALRNRGMGLSEIARRTGNAPSVIHYYLALLDLDQDSLDRVRAGTLPSTVAIQAVRENRQQARAGDMKPLRGRPKVTVKATWFGRTHRLATKVRAACTHSDRAKLGTIGCGECWEQAIIDDARPARHPEECPPGMHQCETDGPDIGKCRVCTYQIDLAG